LDPSKKTPRLIKDPIVDKRNNQENTNPNLPKRPSYMNPTNSSVQKNSTKTSILSKPVDRGVTKPVTRRATIQPTVSRQPRTSVLTGKTVVPKPIQPRALYSTSQLCSPTRKSTNVVPDNELREKLQAMEGMMSTLVSQISVMQNQFIKPAPQASEPVSDISLGEFPIQEEFSQSPTETQPNIQAIKQIKKVKSRKVDLTEKYKSNIINLTEKLQELQMQKKRNTIFTRY